MSVSLLVHRTIRRAEIRALYMVLMKLCWPAEMFSDHRGVLQALNKGEVLVHQCQSQGRDSLGSSWRK